MISVQLTVLREDVEVEAVARFEYHRAYLGRRDSLGGVRGAGPPLEPDEPEELEFISATANGEDCDLTDEEIDRAREKAWNQLN